MASFSYRDGGCACSRDKCSNDCATYRSYNPKPVTNYDSIINKSPEELAKFIFPLGSCPTDKNGIQPFDSGKCSQDCYKCWLDWLKQEADEK